MGRKDYPGNTRNKSTRKDSGGRSAVDYAREAGNENQFRDPSKPAPKNSKPTSFGVI